MSYFWRIVNSLPFGISVIAVGQLLSIAGDTAWCRLNGLPVGSDGLCGDGTLVPSWISTLGAALILVGIGVVLAAIFKARSDKPRADVEGLMPQGGRATPSRASASGRGSSGQPSHLNDPLANPFHPMSPLHEDSADSEPVRRTDSSNRAYDSSASSSSSLSSDSSSSSDSGSCSSSCD